MIRKNLLLALVFLIPTFGFSQYGIGLYHLGNNVVQTNHMNAAFVPDARIWVGLPLSLSFDLHSSHSFEDYFTKSEGKQNLDYDKILANSRDRNASIIQGRLNTFSFGYRLPDGQSTAYFFTNERVNGFISYPKDIITLLNKGNIALLEKDVKLSNLRASTTYFREIGLGYTADQSDALTIGIRLKYLNGIFNASSDAQTDITYRTGENKFETSLDISNAVMHTSGFSDGSFNVLKGAGKGFGMDLGLDYEVNRLLSVNAAVNDIGRITWEKGVVNYALPDTSVRYDGIIIDKFRDDITDVIRDTINNVVGTVDTSATSYKTWLNANLVLGLRAQFGKKHEAYFTASSTFYYGRPKTVLGVGYGYKPKDWIKASLTIVKPPKQLVDIGGSLVIDAGPVQWFVAVDKVLGYRNVAKATGADVSIGLNLLFGRPKRKDDDAYSGNYDDNYWNLDALQRPGLDVKIGEKHNIYDIVRKKESPAKWKRWLKRKEKKIKKIHAHGRKPKSTRNGLK